MQRLIVVLGLLLPLVLLPRQAEAAALKAVISSLESPVFEQPSENSRVKEVLKAGDPISLNEQSRQGFYYGRTRAGTLGWVRILDVRIVGRFDPQAVSQQAVSGAVAREGQKSKEGAESRKVRPWRLIAGYGLNGFAHSDIVSQFDDPTAASGLTAGGSALGLELDYLISPLWAVGLKVNRLSQSLALTCTDESNNQVNCTFSSSAYEALLGGRFRVPLSEMVRLELGLFGGFGFAAEVKALEATGGFSQLNGSGFALHADMALEIELNRQISIFGQAGYHAFKGSQVLPTFGEDQNLQQDRAFFDDPAAIDLTGLSVFFGVGFRLPW